MTDRIEKIFTKFANEEEEALNKMGMTKTEFIEKENSIKEIEIELSNL